MRRFPLVLTLLVLVSLLFAACTPAAPSAAPAGEEGAAEGQINLVLLTHFGSESYLQVMQQKIDEYMELNPNVTIEHQTVPFDQLLNKIVSGRTAGITPDIYHIYNLWLPEFVSGGMLSAPPPEIDSDIRENFSTGSVQAVTIDGTVWGYPTEVNTYQLIYNKAALAEAGFDAPPATWEELQAMAPALTVMDENGQVAQTGFGVITGWDSGVVHPFLTLLWSNNGEYIDVDNADAVFNDEAGLETLRLYTDLIESGGTDPGVNAQSEFPAGRVAMTIMANWWRSTLLQSFEDGLTNIGVAPIPAAADGTSTTVQYNWLFSVDEASQQKEAAWAFLQWMNSPRGEGQLSPAGEFLYEALGALPSRTSDLEALSPQLDDFLMPFVDSLQTARPEPVIAGGQEVKTKLQTEIEAVWFGQKTPEEALEAAEVEADQILQERSQ